MTSQPFNTSKSNTPERGEKPDSICPYLGGPKDRDIYYQYATNWNRCYKPDSSQRVIQSQQSDYCLNDQYDQCEVYKSGWNGVFPAELIAEPIYREGRKRSAWSRRQVVIAFGFVLAALLLLVIAYFGLYTQSGRNNFLASLGFSPGQESAQVFSPTATLEVEAPILVSTQTALPASTIVPVVVEEPTVTPEPSPTSMPTSTPFPTPGPSFGTPFGPDGGFVIHIVVGGESFTSIARRYGSNAEVIAAINPIFEGASLWVGQQLVVPVGVTERGELPIFAIYFTPESSSLEELSLNFSSSAEGIRFYNSLGESNVVPSGRWLIIPTTETN